RVGEILRQKLSRRKTDQLLERKKILIVSAARSSALRCGGGRRRLVGATLQRGVVVGARLLQILLCFLQTFVVCPTVALRVGVRRLLRIGLGRRRGLGAVLGVLRRLLLGLRGALGFFRRRFLFGLRRLLRR